MEEIDLVKTVMNREEEERRLQEKINWFEMMQGEDGVNLCESCPSSIEIRDDGPIIGDFFQNIENEIDYKRFLDEEYFVKNPGDKRFRRLFLLYQGWEEGDIENTLNALGITREQADRLVDGYLSPKIKAAEEESNILRE
jgi:hypothetical protein